MPLKTGPVDDYREKLDSIDSMREKLANMGISNNHDDSKIHVIHIDDKYGNLIITKKMLEDLDPNLTVHSFQSPSEALKNIDKDTDLVLTGLHMTEIDGITLTQTIKQTHNIPVVIYSGVPFRDYIQEAFLAGADDACKLEIDPYHYWALGKRILNLVSKKPEKTTGKLYPQTY
jgi:two-component system response regulator RpfG